MTPAPASAHTVSLNAAAVETPADNGPRSISIPRDARGHFETEGRIEGQRIAFMVDTGASVVALNGPRRRGSASVPRAAITTPPSPPPTAPSRRRARNWP